MHPKLKPASVNVFFRDRSKNTFLQASSLMFEEKQMSLLQNSAQLCSSRQNESKRIKVNAGRTCFPC